MNDMETENKADSYGLKTHIVFYNNKESNTIKVLGSFHSRLDASNFAINECKKYSPENIKIFSKSFFKKKYFEVYKTYYPDLNLQENEMNY